MKKIFTLLAVAAVAVTANAELVVVNALPVDDPAVEAKLVNAGTVIVDNDAIKVTTVFDATAGKTASSADPEAVYTYPDGLSFPTWFELRAKLSGAEFVQDGTRTPLIIEVKKPIATLNSYVRTGNNKTVNLYDSSVTALTSTNKSEVDAGSTSNNFWIWTWSNLAAGTYTMSEAGGTGRFSGLSYELADDDSSAITDITVDENAPVEYFNLQGIRVDNPENGLYIKRQGNNVTKVLVK